MHEGLLQLAMWRLKSLKMPKDLTLDVDGLPIEVFGQQQGSRYNKYVGCRHYSPLIASIAETGDMVVACCVKAMRAMQSRLTHRFLI